MLSLVADDRESRAEKLNRQHDQLLQEARVVMPGVQILFAFLLAVPFQQRFADTDDFQRALYLAALLFAALATACFIAPAAYHRIVFDRDDKEHLVALASRFLIAGVALLALAMTTAVMLVTDLWFSAGTVAAVAAPLALVFLAVWFVFPLLRRRKVDGRA